MLKNMKICKDEEEMKLVAGKICRNYLKGPWKDIDPTEIDFRRISGGLSNFLYYVALPSDEKHRKFTPRDPSPGVDQEAELNLLPAKKCSEVPRKVLLRIYGQVHGPRAMDAIVTESVIFTLLSERGLGPKLHGVFSGGRIEEFISARPLLTKEMAEPSFSMKIAQKMAAIHSLEVPLSKEPNWLWKTINNWLNTTTTERFTDANIDSATEEEREIIKKLREVNWAGELEWLKRFIEEVQSPVVFCHNDLQEGNILLMIDESTTDDEDPTASIHNINQYYLQSRKHSPPYEDDANTSDSVSSHISDNGDPKLVIIDYEYCAYNYRGFDLANHFQEWLYDYTNPEKPYYYENYDNEPTLEQKEIFIKEYLKHYNEIPENQVQDPTVSIDEVNHLLSEVEAFALVSHYFWTLWSIVNASKSEITFGYWEYALSRLEFYYRLKQAAIKKDKYGVSVKRKICEVDI